MTINYPSCDWCGECKCCPTHNCKDCKYAEDTMRRLEPDLFVIAPTYQEGMEFINADPKWTVLAPTNPVALTVFRKSNHAVVRIMNKIYDPAWLHDMYEHLTGSDGVFSWEIED